MRKFLDQEGLRYLWTLIKTYVTTKVTASYIAETLGNTAVNKAKDADTVDGKHASAFSLTSHHHNGTYALANHSHDGINFFGTLDMSNETIDINPFTSPTYTVYEIDRNGIEKTVLSAYACPVWHKILLRNRTEEEIFFVFHSEDTESGRSFECSMGRNAVVEATLVRYNDDLLITFSYTGRAI